MSYQETGREETGRKRTSGAKGLIGFLVMLVVVFTGAGFWFFNHSRGKEEKGIELEGIYMNSREFLNTYTPDLDETALKRFFRGEKLYLSDLVWENGNISMSAQLVTSEEENITFHIKGALYAGHKRQLFEIPAVVADVEETGTEVEVLLLELINAPGDRMLWVDTKLKEVPNMKIFLTYQGNLYLFERELPEELEGISDEGLEPITDTLKDSLWFARFAPEGGKTNILNFESSEE